MATTNTTQEAKVSKVVEVKEKTTKRRNEEKKKNITDVWRKIGNFMTAKRCYQTNTLLPSYDFNNRHKSNEPKKNDKKKENVRRTM